MIGLESVPLHILGRARRDTDTTAGRLARPSRKSVPQKMECYLRERTADARVL